ncbi:MAG: invasion associated locus B family protein [Devosiaceae bacterium]|nr:invasion associated locus B family protein [Devosiaceae bacterium]
MSNKLAKSIKNISAFAVAMLAFVGAPMAFAQEVTNLGTFKFWTAWKGKDTDGVICYISSQPQDSQPTNVNRDPIHFLVIHRKGSNYFNEIQALVGYPIEIDSKPIAIIDGKSYTMTIDTEITDGSAAWLASTNDERAFVDGMKRGRELIVKGTSQRGTNTTDTYSLSGVTAAIAEIDKTCK